MGLEGIQVFYPWGKSGKERQKELLEEAEHERKIKKKFSIRDFPFVTCIIILLNVAIFVIFSPLDSYYLIISEWGFTPSRIADLRNFLNFFTYMFLHLDLLHLLINMFVFFQFGCVCERRLGIINFLILYFASGVGAALFHALFNLGSEIPCIGASGAIFGVLASYALLFPKREVYLVVRFIYVKVPSIVGISIVVFLEFFYTLIGINPHIAHTAHLGGVIAGILATAAMFPGKTADLLLDLLDALIPYT